MSMPTILVVDDCQSIRLAVKRTLTEAGYSVVVACDGEDALGKMIENPALVILDVNMPGLDGFGFCERMAQKNPGCQDIPVVFLTTEKSKAIELLGNELGAYLHKPTSSEELLAVVETQLQRSRFGREAQQGA